MTTEEMLRNGYNAYGEHVQWTAHTGKPMPKWEDLPPATKGAWAAFARSVIADVQKVQA